MYVCMYVCFDGSPTVRGSNHEGREFVVEMNCETGGCEAPIFTVARDSGRLLYFGRVIF